MNLPGTEFFTNKYGQPSDSIACQCSEVNIAGPIMFAVDSLNADQHTSSISEYGYERNFMIYSDKP
jgi:hypothetical protein